MLAAFWPVWRWWAQRILADPEQAWSLLALAAALILWTRSPHIASPAWLPSFAVALVCTFAIVWRIAPPLIAGTFAVASLALTISLARDPHAPAVGIIGLCVLALPLFASVEFMIGFPLRLAASRIASSILALAGIPIALEGTSLRWTGGLVEIGAPCSGIHMLWAALVCTFFAIALHKLNWRRAAALTALSVSTVIAGNGVRAASLFFLESGMLPVPAAAHPAIHAAVGLVLFAAIAALTNRCAHS